MGKAVGKVNPQIFPGSLLTLLPELEQILCYISSQRPRSSSCCQTNVCVNWRVSPWCTLCLQNWTHSCFWVIRAHATLESEKETFWSAQRRGSGLSSLDRRIFVEFSPTLWPVQQIFLLSGGKRTFLWFALLTVLSDEQQAISRLFVHVPFMRDQIVNLSHGILLSDCHIIVSICQTWGFTMVTSVLKMSLTGSIHHTKCDRSILPRIAILTHEMKPAKPVIWANIYFRFNINSPMFLLPSHLPQRTTSNQISLTESVIFRWGKISPVKVHGY